MADTRISNLAAETAAPGDEIPVNRGGVNYKITAGDILKQDSGTLTADAPALDLTQTWNNSGVTFTGLKFNAVSTDSASGSLLMDLQVGGTSQFKVTKSGAFTFGSFGVAGLNGMQYSGGALTLSRQASGTTTVTLDAESNSITTGTLITSNGALNFTSDLLLRRDAANTLAQRNGTNAQTFRIYNTTDAGIANYERGFLKWDSNVLKIGTEKAGTGTARALEFQTDGTTRFTISATSNTLTAGVGGATVNLGVGILISQYINNSNNSLSMFQFVADTTGTATYAVGATSPLLRFGGTTSSFPALKRSSTSLIVRLADDSANAPLESASLKTDAPTGGTAATWKLGTVASVTPTSPDRTIEVDIGGTIYYLHAKTTND